MDAYSEGTVSGTAELVSAGAGAGADASGTLGGALALASLLTSVSYDTDTMGPSYRDLEYTSDDRAHGLEPTRSRCSNLSPHITSGDYSMWHVTTIWWSV